MERPKWFCIMILRPTASISLAMAPGIIIGRQTWRDFCYASDKFSDPPQGWGGSELWYVTPPFKWPTFEMGFFIGANLCFVHPKKKWRSFFTLELGFLSPTCGPKKNLKGLLNKSFCFQKPSWCITLLVSADFFFWVCVSCRWIWIFETQRMTLQIQFMITDSYLEDSIVTRMTTYIFGHWNPNKQTFICHDWILLQCPVGS